MGKLRFGSCKTKTTNDVDGFKESEKKSEEKSNWNIIVKNVIFIGKEQ